MTGLPAAESTPAPATPTPQPAPAAAEQPAAEATPAPADAETAETTAGEISFETDPSPALDPAEDRQPETPAAIEIESGDEAVLLEADETIVLEETDIFATDDDFIPLPEGVLADELLGLDGEPLPDTPSFVTDEDFLFADDLPPLDMGPEPLPAFVGEPEREIRARYRRLQIRMEKDPGVVSLREQAEQARTDEDKRAARRAYYRLLFSKMREADPSLEERCNVMEAAYLRRLEQSRVEPTIPLNPPPTPQPLD